ncbi:hypothetical protein ABZ851_23565 [Streptomyces sp. NPDC047049]|uniref:DUF6571 family protein n=1 Tax=Streptomyces sp. NPDC047049 TaxID=3156688 RepID=UPI003402D799
MPTYEQLYHLELRNLKEAVERWADMPTRMKALLTSFTDHVEKPFNAAEWISPMLTAQAARMKLTMCHKDFDAAGVEAKGIHGILADVYGELKKAKEDLHHLADVKAPAQGLYVTAKGVVHIRDPKPEDLPADTDPASIGLGPRSKNLEQVDALAQDIQDVLDRAAEADETACWGLRKDVGGKHADAFNSKDVTTSLDSADAQHAVQLIRHGNKMTDRQMSELQEIMHRNRKDPEFATYFYKNLGPKKTIETIAKLSAGMPHASEGRRDIYKELKKEMGRSLATATDPDNKPHLSDAWNADLRKAGSGKLDRPWENEHIPYYGYQALGEILREGNYDPHFLVPVAEHATQIQAQHPEDMLPTAGILDALGHSPQASTDFFNGPMHAYSEDGTPQHGAPDLGKGQNGKPIHNYLDYFTDPGHQWNPETHPESPTFIWGDWDAVDKSISDASKNGPISLGHALEAAVSGNPYDDDSAQPAKHTAQEAGLMRKVVDKFGHHPELIVPKAGEEKPLLAHMTGSLGNMTAGYMGDFQQSLSAHGNLPSYGAPAHLDADSARTFLGKVGQDPAAYASISASQQAYTAVQVDQAMNAHTDSTVGMEQRVANATHPGATISGIMSQARAEAVHETHAAEDKEFNDQVVKGGRLVNRVSMIATGSIPGAAGNIGGNIINHGVNEITEEAMARLKHDTTPAAQYEAGQKYSNGMGLAQESARAAVAQAAERGHFNQSTLNDLKNTASDAAMDGHTAGAQWEDSRHG